jgi:hypothetical protein
MVPGQKSETLNKTAKKGKIKYKVMQ